MKKRTLHDRIAVTAAAILMSACSLLDLMNFDDWKPDYVNQEMPKLTAFFGQHV